MPGRNTALVAAIVTWVPLLVLLLIGVLASPFPNSAFGSTSGWLSAGLFSTGVLSAGLFSMGVYSAGVFSIGIFSAGVFSIGVFSFGTFALGVWASGQFASGRFCSRFREEARKG